MKRLYHIHISLDGIIPKPTPLCTVCVKRIVHTFPIVFLLYHKPTHYAMCFLYKKKSKTLYNVLIDEHYTMCYTVITARTTTCCEEQHSTATEKIYLPCCGNSVRATKRVNVVCGDCMQQMIER